MLTFNYHFALFKRNLLYSYFKLIPLIPVTKSLRVLCPILLCMTFISLQNLKSQDCNLSEYHYDNFERGFVFWKDGGDDCLLDFWNKTSGLWGVRLRDDRGEHSSIFTSPLDLTGTTEVEFDFMLKFNSMEHGEDLYLEYALSENAQFITAHRWISGENFHNRGFENQKIQISDNFTSETIFRFRCDASSKRDHVFLDDMRISVCESNEVVSSDLPEFRSVDGSGNNTNNPEWGAANTSLFREVPAQYGDGIGSMGGTSRPSARHISNQLSDEPEVQKDERQLSGMIFQFGQFLDHDFVSTQAGDEVMPILVPDYDPVFTSSPIIPFTRSKAVEGSSPREQLNLLSSYIDGSNVYGSDLDKANWLRSGIDGKLKISTGNLLPFNTIDGEYDSAIDLNAPHMAGDRDRMGNPIKVFVAGDVRANEQPNLAAFHLLFVREHNRICENLIKSGETDDEVIYQKARKLVGAILQYIVYDEFLPALGINLSSYSGYDPTVRAEITNTFTTAAYRWHTMVENDIILRNDECEGIGPVQLPLKTVFLNTSILRNFGPGVLLRGLSFQTQYQTDLKINNGLRNFLFGPGAGLDLAALNLQRGRDHGLPDYNTVREFYGLGKVSSFNSINPDQKISGKLQELYNDVDDIDLWVGLFAEPNAAGSSLPETVIRIMASQFEDLRDGDIYFYLNDPYLSSDDLSLITSSSLANVIERNTSARSMQSNVFFIQPCDEDDLLQDLTDDEGTQVCSDFNTVKFHLDCEFDYGFNVAVGTYSYFWLNYVERFEIELGYAVRIHHRDGRTAYFTDDSGCLSDEWVGNINSVEVICLSNDPTTIECTGFAGALFTECFGTPYPIFTPGSYNTEQMKSLSLDDNSITAIRVNNGFKVTLYTEDEFTGSSIEYLGPTVVCLPTDFNGKISSLEAVCISNPNFSNCGFNGIAGAVFPENSPGEDHLGHSFGIGDFDEARMEAMGIEGNQIEKVQVNNGYAITLFDDDNFEGWSATFLGNESNLGTYSNGAQSMKATCIEGLQFLVASPSILDLKAEAIDDEAHLEILFDLSKEPISHLVQKFNGKEGVFETLDEFSITSLNGSFNFIDEQVLIGDNIYRVKVQYADGTEEETEYKSVHFDTDNVLKIYPNPASDFVTIGLEDFYGSDLNIVIHDVAGRVMSTQQISNLATSELVIDVSQLNSGAYILQMIPNDGQIFSEKFIVRK